MASPTKLWVLRNDTVRGYDTYDSMVVAAETEEAARAVLPPGIRPSGRTWCYPEEVICEYIGVTDREFPDGTIILSSFNAG